MSRACFICAREAAHHLKYKGKTVCGSCAPVSAVGERMILTDGEAEALEAGGALGGEYLDSIGKTDLATLTGEQWTTFLTKIFAGYSEHMSVGAHVEPPF